MSRIKPDPLIQVAIASVVVRDGIYNPKDIALTDSQIVRIREQLIVLCPKVRGTEFAGTDSDIRLQAAFVRKRTLRKTRKYQAKRQT